jgi:hypothetical protein
MLFDERARLEIDSRPGRTIVTMDLPAEDGAGNASTEPGS